jgi:hypothetical protein
VAFLPAESLDFADGHSLNTHLGERFFDVLHFEGLDYGLDLFHVAGKESEAMLTGKHQDLRALLIP